MFFWATYRVTDTATPIVINAENEHKPVTGFAELVEHVFVIAKPDPVA